MYPLKVGETLQQSFERNPRLQTGQWSTQAEVNAIAKAQVTIGSALDIKAVGVGELCLIEIGRGEER